MMYTATQLAKEFGIDATTVGGIFVSVKVKRPDKEYNVGLKIKSTSRDVSNPKFAQYRNSKWYYSEDARKDARCVLREYVARFPTIVRAIRNSKGIYFQFNGDRALR